MRRLLQSPRAWLRLLAALAALYLLTTLPFLANDPIAGGDEGWIISASAKLADDGVFGTDLFAGFYDAEDRYYFNLPLQHLVLAAVFKVAGVGLLQARLVSVVFGLAALFLTFAFGRRLGGVRLGLLAASLIFLLRLNLAPFSGLTLTDLGATVRYDLFAAVWGLAAVYVMTREAESPRPKTVALAGLLVGLAATTQFLGAFFGPPLALFLLTASSIAWKRRVLLTGLLTAVALLPLALYGVYLAQDWDDFRGQGRTVEQDTDLLSPAFYAHQLWDERHRYALATGLEDVPSSLGELVEKPSARLALLLLGPLALLHVARRARTGPAYRLLALTIAALLLELALFESTKRFVYWVVVVPFLCVALADLLLALWDRPPRPSQGSGRLIYVLPVLALALFAAEGLAVAARDLKNALDAPSFAELGDRVSSVVPSDSVVLTDNRMWPALHPEIEPRSLLLLFYHTNPGISRDRVTDIPGAIGRVDPDYVLLTPLSREILAQLTPRDADAFRRFLEERTERLPDIPYPTYGPIEVYRVER